MRSIENLPKLARGHRAQRGFTLIELLAVVAILGILAAVAVGAYAKQVRNAHKSEVISDLSNLKLRQQSFMGISGHYASSNNCEGPACTYPTGAAVTAAGGELAWDINDAAYTGSGLGDGQFTRGGAAVHGFDALRFMPEGARSYCGYGTVSGWGTDALDPENADEPPADTLAQQIFPTDGDSDLHFARDWFYAYALCDFDHDGTYWAFTNAHYTSDVNSTTDATGTYQENE